MRAFWAIVLVLLLAGGAAAFFSHPAAPAVTPTLAEETPSKVSTPTAAPAPTPAPEAPKSAPAAPVAAAKPAPTLPPPAPAIDFGTDLDNAINTAVKSNAPAAPAKTDTEAGIPFDLPTTAAFPIAKMIPAKAVKLGNEIVIDGKYHIKGAGTAEDPYIVPFDLLMSAQDSFDPRKGLSKMPQRVAFLHEKHIRLMGYVAFPISSTDPKEMLSMFNQWDGCCIGVPPTAYDAVETKLAKPVTGDDKFITFGSTTGIFKVDPYIDNGWLLGLYLMDDAKLTDGKTDPISPKQIRQDN